MSSRFLIPALLFSLSAPHVDAQVSKPTNKAALVRRSDGLIARRDYRQAALELSKAIALNPRDAELYVLRSFAYGAGGEQHKAEDDRQRFASFDPDEKKPLLVRSLRQFQALATREPKNVHAYLNIGDLQSYLLDYPGALKSFNRAVILAPQSAMPYIGRGFIYAQTNEFNKALTDFNRAIALQPREFDGYNGRAYVYLSQGKLDLALKECDKAISLDSRNSSSFWLRGLVQGSRANSQAAVSDYDKAILLNPLNTNAYIGRASARLAIQHIDSTLEDLQIAERLRPSNPEIYSMRAMLHSQRKEYAQAVTEYDRAISLSPKNASLYYLRGENLFQQAEKESNYAVKALADYTRAVELAPKDPQVYLYRASYYFLKDELAKALPDLGKVLELDPDNVDAYSIRAATYSKLSEDDKAIADYRKLITLDKSNGLAINHIAIYEASQAIKADPTIAANYAKRAEARNNIGETAAALTDYNEAIRLDPKNPNYYNFRGVIYANQRSLLEANADFDRAIEADPKFIQAYVNRISISTDPAQTFAEIEKVIKVDPNNLGAYTKRAALYLKQEQTDLAMADYNRILQIDPKQASIYAARAELYADKNEPVKAIADYDAAIRLSPPDVQLFRGRGWQLFKRGDLDRAEADYKKALGPTNPDFTSDGENLRVIAISRRIGSNPKDAANYIARARVFMASLISRTRDEEVAAMVLADLNEASVLAPRSAEPHLLRARLFGKDDSAVSNPTNAIAACTEGLKLDPKMAELYNLRGNNNLVEGNYGMAVADYVAAGKLDPGYAPGLYGRNLFGKAAEQKKGIAFFTAAMTRSPRSAAAYFNRAVLYADMNVWDKSIADYGQAIRLDPKMVNAYYLRGIAQFQMATDYDWRNDTDKMTGTKRKNVLDSAVVDYSTAIRLDPKFASAYYQRAILWDEQKADRAIGDYSTFIQLNPRYAAHAHYSRGQAYVKHKQWDKVIADFAAFQRLPEPISTQSSIYYMRGSAPWYIADAYVGKGDYSKAIAKYNEVMNTPGEGRHGKLHDRGKAYLLSGNAAKAITDFNAAVVSFPNYPDVYTLRAIAYRKLGQIERAGVDEQMAAILSKK